MPRQRVGDRQRDQHRRDEHGGRGENAGVLAADSSGGRNGASSGANSAGRELATKNSSSGPRSSASLRPGLSCGFRHGCVCVVHARSRSVDACASLIRRSTRITVSIPAIALAKSLAANGARSSMPSPTPMKCTGRPILRGDRHQDAAARGAVELGHDEAGDARDLAEHLDLRQRVLADRGVEHQQHRVRRRRHRPSSSRARSFPARPSAPALFCSRPAVSTSSTSISSPRASVSASKARPAASAPGSRAITAAPVRPPQILSWSIAAARNVSPAASITARPSARSFAASLPMVVVLPEPLTPTTRMTNGLAPSIASGLRHRRQDLLDLGGEHRLHLVRRDLLVVAALADRRRRCAPRDVDAEIGADQRLLDLVDRIAASSLRLRMTRSVIAPPIDARGALEPAAEPLPPASRCLRSVLSFMSAAVIAVSP